MQLRCADPDAWVRGSNVRATFDEFGLLPAIAHTILTRHGITRSDLDNDAPVPMQSWLNAIADISEVVGGGEAVRNVARRAILKATIPPSFDTAEKILLALDAIYHINHTGVTGEVGHYRVTQPDENTIVVRCETPYPSEAEQGIIEGLASLRGKRTVELIPGDGITHSCTLVVRRV